MTITDKIVKDTRIVFLLLISQNSTKQYEYADMTHIIWETIHVHFEHSLISGIDDIEISINFDEQHVVSEETISNYYSTSYQGIHTYINSGAEDFREGFFEKFITWIDRVWRMNQKYYSYRATTPKKEWFIYSIFNPECFQF